MVLLLAFGLAMDNLAARNNALLPMIWLHAVTPGRLRVAAVWTAMARMAPPFLGDHLSR